LVPGEVIRATVEEKEHQLSNLEALHGCMAEQSAAAIERVQQAAVTGANIFEELLEACKCCSLGQLTDALFEVGGAYRRNM
jgi:methylmalonyl-CoA mutase